MKNKDRAQAWVELKTEDPEAFSALAVARARLAAASGLESVRRFRVFEIEGGLPDPGALEDLLHRSTWFYNPHKERCTVRRAAGEDAPCGRGEIAVLVVESGGDRRPAAERWWRHETGGAVEVREGVVWALRFARGEDATARASDLAEVRDPAHGLLCNSNFQSCSVMADAPPIDWIRRTAAARPASKERS